MSSAGRADPGFEELLEFLRETRGFDYTDYKRPSLMRRFQKRMSAVGVSDFADYRTYLEAEPREVQELFDTILINVTGFFRDGDSVAVPRRGRHPEDPRAGRPGPRAAGWSAGCATGEEPFTLAMLFAEALGDDDFRRRVKIYATDVDEDALSQARSAVLPGRQGRERPRGAPGALLPAARRALRLPQRAAARGDLRAQRPPSGPADLTRRPRRLAQHAHVLRRPAQRRILGNFRFALNPAGYLVLGTAEALTRHADLFAAYDLTRRVFVTTEPTGDDRPPRERRFVVAEFEPEDQPASRTPPSNRRRWPRSSSTPPATSPRSTSPPARSSGCT